jgi:D-arabinose 1-dehydrogenase-like Zn-dependent alcohol dehydrogenase
MPMFAMGMGERGWAISMGGADQAETLPAHNATPTGWTVPLERAFEAYSRMRSGESRFRMVLTMPPRASR